MLNVTLTRMTMMAKMTLQSERHKVFPGWIMMISSSLSLLPPLSLIYRLPRFC